MSARLGTGVLLQLRAHSLFAEAYRGRRVVWTGEAEFHALSDLAQALGELVSAPEVGKRFRRLSVVVERPLVQLRRVADMPPVRERVLKALVQTHAGRLFRRNGTPLVTDAIWVGHNGTRAAQMCAIETPVLEALAEGARAAGLRLESVVPTDGTRLSLLPPSTRAAQLFRLRRSATRWGVAALSAWSVVAASYFGRLTLERRRVEAELTRLEKPAAALVALHAEMRAAREMVGAVDAAEKSGHTLGRRLADVAVAVPDSAFLSSLTISSDGRGVVTGYARQAAEVAASFDRSARIRTPKLEGHQTKEFLFGREWDRFTISLGDSAKTGSHRGS
jgi:hypothetical protein